MDLDPERQEKGILAKGEASVYWTSVKWMNGGDDPYPERASQVVKDEIISAGPSESIIVE